MVGAAGGGAFHWAAALVPWTLSCLCLFLDRRVQRFLGQMNGMPVSGSARETV